MDAQVAFPLLVGWLRSAVSGVGWVWNAIPAEWRAPAALAAGGGTVFGGLVGWMRYRREHRPLHLALVPGKYSGHVPADQTEAYPFDLTITNRASTANSVIGVRFFVDAAEQHCGVLPLNLLRRPIEPWAAFQAKVVVSARLLMDGPYREVRFVVEPGRGRQRTFRIKAGALVSTY